MSMWPVSQRYLDTIPRNHDQLVYLEVIQDGETIATVQGGSIYDPDTNESLYTVGGSVEVSNTTIRRSGTITFADPSGLLTPLRSTDLLAPYVTEIRVWIGVRYWDASNALFGGTPWYASPPVTGAGYGAGLYGTGLYGFGVTSFDPEANGLAGSIAEFVPVGTLIVTNPQNPGRQLSIQGYDRMWLLHNFDKPYSVSRGTPVNEALISLLSLKVPTPRLDYSLVDTEETVGPLTFDADSSVADAVHQMTSSAGLTIAVDPMGVFFTYVPPSTDDDAELVLEPGSFSVMMRPQRAIGDNEGPYNAVVYTNEGGKFKPARGYAEDTNPNSLTNVRRIGVRPKFKSSPLLPDKEACNKASRTALMHLLGISDALSVSMIPNHALDTDVVLDVTDESQGMVNMKVITDSFSVPLRASDGLMNVTCRPNVSLE